MIYKWLLKRKSWTQRIEEAEERGRFTWMDKHLAYLGIGLPNTKMSHMFSYCVIRGHPRTAWMIFMHSSFQVGS